VSLLSDHFAGALHLLSALRYRDDTHLPELRQAGGAGLGELRVLRDEAPRPRAENGNWKIEKGPARRRWLFLNPGP